MERARLTPVLREEATARTCIVSSFATELLEIRSKEPSLHVVLIPGNPGIVAFYKDFVEALYENLGGQASITAIGHISHSQKDAECGRLFSLREQIDHKVDFIEKELLHSEESIVLMNVYKIQKTDAFESFLNITLPDYLTEHINFRADIVGHSIGAYIGLEIFKRLPNKVTVPIFNIEQEFCKAIGNCIYCKKSSLLSKGVSSFASFIGSLQYSVTRGIVRRFLGPSWSVTAIDAACRHLLRYHTMRNVLFMAKTEFQKLTEEPDWTFIRAKQDEIALLFGVGDHWGPISHLEEVSKRAPRVALSVETEGHTHGYCCTEAGSFWVADYVANLIIKRTNDN
ncbi:hypothetical protein ACP70R_036057 [Stipagrostis hirtigluma subsp. patula]